ncbi:hypothetical protein Tco_1367174, partial [Tanacetum coccineum]
MKIQAFKNKKRSQDDNLRLCLADDLKEAQNHMKVKLKGISSSLKSNDHYTYHKLKDKDSRPRAKTEDIHRIEKTLWGRLLGCDLPYGEIVRNQEKTRLLLKYVAR